MERPPSEDVPLFSTRSLEGEYTAWAFVWSREYGAGVNLNEVRVDNDGTVYVEEFGPPDVYVRTFLGVETNIPNYTFHLLGINSGFSATGKYVIGTPSAPWRELEVWRDGAIIFSRDVQLDDGTVIMIERVAISPNGKFAALIITSTAFMIRSLVMLYEGT